MQYYIEVARGDVSRRNRFIPLESLGQEQAQAVGSGDELYRSYYLYGPEVFDHLKTKATIRGYLGPVAVWRLAFDIDKGSNSNVKTLEIARAFYEKLHEHWTLEEIRPWFSGRGYHFECPDTFGFGMTSETPELVKATLSKLYEEADKIYDRTRLYRVGNTVNKKTGLFKIPLSAEELFKLTFEEIAEMAKGPRKEFTFPPMGEVKVTRTQEILKPATTADMMHQTLEVFPDGFTPHVTCMQKLYKKGGEEGHRHEGLLRLGASWRNGGLTYDAALELARSWAPGWDRVEVERMLSDIYRKAYNPFRCSDPVMAKYCDTRCKYYGQKNYGYAVLDTKALEAKFHTFVNQDMTGRTFDLLDVLGIPGEYPCFPGELVVFYGDTGLGKSTLVMNIGVVLRTMRILWFSLENNAVLHHLRLTQIAHGMTKEEVTDHYRGQQNTLSAATNHIISVFERPTLEQLDTAVAEIRPQLVVVDTLNAVLVPRVFDVTDRTEQVAMGLKAMAQRRDCIVLAVAHIGKGSGKDWRGESKRLDVHGSKGSSAIEQEADKMLALEGQPDMELRELTSLKARMAAPFRVQLRFNKQTFQFTKGY